MKSSRLLPCAVTLALTSCAQLASTLQEPITSEYNPLDGPNAPRNRISRSVQPTGPSYKPGQWVETAMANSTFFRKIPRGNATADKVLSKGSPLKVISTKGSYVKVELEGGNVGYIPAIMVAEPNSSANATPFLPPPPSSPLQRSDNNDSFAPASLPTSSSPDFGSSVIPPPEGYNENAPVSIPPTRGSSEVLIPTRPAPVEEIPAATIGGGRPGVIPLPTGGGIDQTIGIE